MTLTLSMTLGDLAVAGSVVSAIIGAYFALKHLLTSMHVDLKAVIERVDEHDDILTDHGEGIAALESRVFGRRRNDKKHHGG